MPRDNFSNCKKCNAQIAWVKTKKGKNMPVDANLNYHGETEFIWNTHTPHFKTCPYAEEFRKKE